MTNLPVYINSLGSFLPGPPISNGEMETTLGLVGEKPSKIRPFVLRQNKIKRRHYAIDAAGRFTHRVSELAALAVGDALSRWTGSRDKIDLLVAATSQGDSLVPSFASGVHAELKLKPCEILSVHGVCASGLMALRAAQLAIMSGQREAAVACSGELSSRFFRPGFLNVIGDVADGSRLDADVEFLRWMLSDGGSAAILEPTPRASGLCLKVDWIDIVSYASEYPTCMYAGARKAQEQGELSRFWYDYPTVNEAVRDGALTLRQDMRLLDHIVKIGVRRYFELIDQGKVRPSQIDWMVCHYSSHHFFDQIQDLLKNTGGFIPLEKWFTNLYDVGNVGSASLGLNLDALFRSGRLKPGQKILCMIPESARFTLGFALLTVTTSEREGQECVAPARVRPETAVAREPTPPASSALKEDALRGLVETWTEFEAQLQTVPFLEKLKRGCLTMADYHALLLNLRQQVVEGSRWIARAGSSLDSDHLALRSQFIRHAGEEHKDFEMIERDYAATGGGLAAIQARDKNIGSEALCAWMFHQASQPNPFDLLGAMFIIEGLGRTFAQSWARGIQAQLALSDDQVSFLLYHGQNDERHMDKFYEALALIPLTPSLSKKIVTTARVTAELYLLQLRRIEGI